MDDPAVHADEDRARRDHDRARDAQWDTDADESAGIRMLLDGREQGFGIPDDVMMRLNISTAVDVREVLDETLPESITEPGTELGYDRRHVPHHVTALVELLQSPDRELTVGGTRIAAGDILGDTWDEYADDVVRKISTHVTVCDLIGARRAIWHAAISGTVYASGWFPNPWWARAVGLLRGAVTDGRTGEVFHSPHRMADIWLPDDAFWETLPTRRAELNGPQCRWVQRTKLGDLIRAVRDSDRERLGPPDDARFSGLAAMF